jgi:hypothetical protein
MHKAHAKTPKRGPAEKLRKVRTKIVALATLDEESSLGIAVKIYCIALYLRNDIDEWQKFCELPEWRTNKPAPQPKPESRQNALRFAIKFAVGFRNESNGNRVRKFNDLLNAAWEKGINTTEIEAHVKNVQEGQRLKASESRAKHRATKSRSITLLSSPCSQLLFEGTGEHTLKGEFKISNAGSPRTSIQIMSLSKKSYKKLGVGKPANTKPTSK